MISFSSKAFSRFRFPHNFSVQSLDRPRPKKDLVHWDTFLSPHHSLRIDVKKCCLLLFSPHFPKSRSGKKLWHQTGKLGRPRFWRTSEPYKFTSHLPDSNGLDLKASFSVSWFLSAFSGSLKTGRKYLFEWISLSFGSVYLRHFLKMKFKTRKKRRRRQQRPFQPW